jgi:hypothetical protein
MKSPAQNPQSARLFHGQRIKKRETENSPWPAPSFWDELFAAWDDSDIPFLLPAGPEGEE